MKRTNEAKQLMTLGFEPIYGEDSKCLCGYFGRGGAGPSKTTHVATWDDEAWSIERLNPKHGGTSGSRILANKPWAKGQVLDSSDLSEMLARCDRITQRQSGEEPVYCGLWGFNDEEKPEDLGRVVEGS